MQGFFPFFSLQLAWCCHLCGRIQVWTQELPGKEADSWFSWPHDRCVEAALSYTNTRKHVTDGVVWMEAGGLYLTEAPVQPARLANVLGRLIERCVFPLALYLHPPPKRKFLWEHQRGPSAMILFPVNMRAGTSIFRCVLVALITRVLLWDLPDQTQHTQLGFQDSLGLIPSHFIMNSFHTMWRVHVAHTICTIKPLSLQLYIFSRSWQKQCQMYVALICKRTL